MPPSTPPGTNMAPGSWKALTAARLTSIKDYVAQKDYRATYDALSSRVRGNNQEKQTWDQWARQTLGRPLGSSADLQRISMGVEKVQLFPGWAVRRYADPAKTDQEGAEFSLDVYVSGFASSVRPPEAATRSQKAFYRIAKGYAALPKLPSVATSSEEFLQRFDLPSDVDLSKLPPTPAKITDESELAALEAHLQQMSSASSSHNSDDEGMKGEDTTPKPRTPHRSSSYDPHRNPSTMSVQPESSLPERLIDHAAHKLHANLDARLQPFWSNAIPNRLVRLSIFCPRTGHAPSEAQESMEGQDTDREPVATLDVITDPQGSFQTKFIVPWERLATHPPTLHVAFGESNIEYPVVIQAEMWTPPPPPSPSPSTSSVPYSPYQRPSASRSQPHLLSTSNSSSSSLTYSQDSFKDSFSSSIKNRVTIPLSVPHVPVRLISDIDDTIKHAGVLLGPKHVFQNVFVRHLDELVVHSMVDWYRTLWQTGVRFHYVSNSPFELLPVLNDFFRVSSLPEGSIKLKSYAARSLLPALLSPPASRKRQGVVEVLDAFPESRFILVGDSGEQDMELYAELARERPKQVIGVFVRDVTTGADPLPREQTVDSGALNAQFGALVVDQEPEPISMPSRESLGSAPSSNSDTRSYAGEAPRSPFARSSPTPSRPGFPGTLPRRGSSAGMTPEEKRRHDLHWRIERAREEIPRHVAFRVFREPTECVEVDALLKMYAGGRTR